MVKNVLYLSMTIVVLIFGCTQVTMAEGQSKDPKSRRNVAILIFDGVEVMDFAGPAEVFIVSGFGKPFRVFTVAETTELVRTMGGLTVKPEFSVKEAPRADIVVVPGGNMGKVDKSVKEWLKKSARDAEVVMSVCMGAFLLAEAGLLDGVEATTHRWGIDGLKRSAPKCTVVRGKRFVDAGKILTTAGVTAGIDGALHLVERFLGKEAARWTAEEWMEYKRQPSKPKE